MNNKILFNELNFLQAILIYVLVGTFFLNSFFYYFYSIFWPLMPSTELIDLNIMSNELQFSGFGYYFSILISVLTSLFMYMSFCFDKLYLIGVCIGVGFILSYILSLIIIPVNIILSLSYMLFMCVVAGIILLHHPKIMQEPKKEVLNEKLIELIHNRWSLLLRESIWIILSVMFTTASIVFIYFSNIAGPIMSEIPDLRIFYLIQIIFFGLFLIYSGGGFVIGITMHIYEKLKILEDLLIISLD